MNTSDSSAELSNEKNNHEKIENKQNANIVPTASIVFMIPLIETLIFIIVWGLLEGFSIYMILAVFPILFWSFVGCAIGATIGRLAIGTRGSVIFWAIFFSLLSLGLGYSILSN